MYDVGTQIDLRHLNDTAAKTQEPEPAHRLYFPGTKVLFIKMSESLHEINITSRTIAFVVQ